MDNVSVNDKLLVSANDAAAMLGIGRSLLYSMASDGRLGITPIRFGKRTLYNVDELRRWVKAGAPCRKDWRKAREQL